MSSWFDPSGIASLAKNALKEAQKTIDKALDIQEDDDDDDDGKSAGDPKAARTKMRQSRSHPVLSATASEQPPDSVWGSIAGTFLVPADQQPGDADAVTTPPSSSAAASAALLQATASASRPKSVDSSVSGSVELVTPPTTPGSSSLLSPVSPGATPAPTSSSIGVLLADTSASSCSPNSLSSGEPRPSSESPSAADETFDAVAMAAAMRPCDDPDEADRLSLEAIDDEDDEDSRSFSTVAEPGQLAGARSTAVALVAESLSDSMQSFEYVPPSAVAAGEAQQRRRSASASPVRRSPDVDGGAAKASGHSSGDDGETATSSDIEIISSPTTNGDSGSTNNSVCKVSVSMCTSQLLEAVAPRPPADDREPADVQRLRRQLAELADVLEARELKLLDVGREMAEMHERCARLQQALDAKRKRDDCLEVSTVTEEYTQRLAALEKKFQQSIRERDALRDQLTAARAELETRQDAESVARQLRDKEFVIGELQHEGEKLSKQVLQHSNIIKKLRVKERDCDAQLKQQADTLAEQADELERLKRTLGAKEDVERTQIEAVHKLSGANRKLERTCVQLRGSLDDSEQRVLTLQTSMEAARAELAEAQTSRARLQRTGDQLGRLTEERDAAVAKQAQLEHEVSTLRAQIRAGASDTNDRERGLRAENRSLLQRLEEMERRAEEESEAIRTATIPLIRQNESLQQTLNQRMAAFERFERETQATIDALQTERTKLRAGATREAQLEEVFEVQRRRLEEQLAELQRRFERAANEHAGEIGAMGEQRRRQDERIAELETLCGRLERQRDELESGRREIGAETERLQQKFDRYRDRMQSELQKLQPKYSATDRSPDELPVGGASAVLDGGDAGASSVADEAADSSSSSFSLPLSETQHGASWRLDEFDSVSNAGRMLPVATSHNASAIEGLQSALKQRDGENHQLQWELSRLNAERNRMMTEISALTEQVDELTERARTNASAADVLSDVQNKYDALLQMYGEKVDEIEELRHDVDDVRELYRKQIDACMRPPTAVDHSNG